jgi:LemA protein
VPCRFSAIGRRLVILLGIVAAVAGASGCGYNDIQRADESTGQTWAEVLNQYQRRADLIDNLVRTVRGYADHEREVLTQVTEARSRVGQIKVDPTDPASLKRFETEQAGVTSALSRLLVVAENYPTLKADQGFRDLQAQLEGTENRIAVARKRFIDSVNGYNVLVRQFPVNLTAMVFGYKPKPQFAVENEDAIRRPPTVDFGRPAGQQPGQAAPARPSEQAPPQQQSPAQPAPGGAQPAPAK